MAERLDDPRFGPKERVDSILLGSYRHLLFDTPEGLLLACRPKRIPYSWKRQYVEARFVSCRQGCQRYLNLG